MSKKVADQIVEMLVQSGVKRIYAVAGDSLNALNDAVRRNKKLQWIHVRHEEAGAYAAAAEAELGGIACCAGSCGPGHVHLINGVYDAHRTGVPLIVIASTIHTSDYGTGYFQDTNTIKLFDDCSCYNQIATTPQQVPKMLQGAIQHALQLKDVAVFGLPGDVSSMSAVDSPVSTQSFVVSPVIRPSATELAQMAQLLNAANKVTLFCGIGAVDAHDEVVQLARLLKSPVGYSFRAKMGIQYDNPYEVGMTGLLGLPAAYHSMQECEVLLLLGTDFPYTAFLPTKNKIIQVELRAERLGRRAKLELGLCGSVKDTLIALLPLIKEKTDDHFLRGQLHLYAKVKETMQVFVDDRGSENLISPEFVAYAINKYSASDAIYTMDTGMSCVWGARYLQATGKRAMLASYTHGSMANAMPMAIGAALTFPGRMVVALCGDGGLSMLLGDLATIKQYKLPIKLVVFNNRALGMVKLEMEVAGLVDNETDMTDPDFALIAQAMGFKGINVHRPEDVEACLQQAFQEEGPVLINIMTNPDALAMPPKVEWEEAKGMATALGKMMLSGRMDEVMSTIKANYKHLKELL